MIFKANEIIKLKLNYINYSKSIFLQFVNIYNTNILIFCKIITLIKKITHLKNKKSQKKLLVTV